MADEQRETLKKKIQILFQLGKFPDVVKLCATYGEKFGQDAEIDQIRFKCQRHMGGAPSAAAPPSAPDMRGGDPSIPLISPLDQAQLDDLAENVPPRAPDEPAFDDLDIGDPFASDDLVVRDPFAGDSGELRLAPEPPPVILPGTGREQAGAGPLPFTVKEAHPDADAAGRDEHELELDEPGDSASGLRLEDREPVFAGMGGMTLDAAPELIPSAPTPSAEPEPDPEPVAETPTSHAVPEPRRTEGPPPSYHGLPVGGTLYHEPERPPQRDMPPARKEVPRIEERRLTHAAMFEPAEAREAPPPRKPFPFRKALFVAVPLLAAAAAAWLLLARRSEPTVEPLPPPRPQPAGRPPARKPPRPAPAAAAVPVAKAEPQGAEAQRSDQDKEFAEKLQQAENLLNLGDLVSAQARLQEAKKIQVTEALKRLEERLQAKVAQAQNEQPPAPSDRERESQALAKARESNTLSAWRDFVRDFPASESLPLAQARIASLEKAAQREEQQRLLQRIRQERSVTLRGNPLNLSQAEVDALAAPGRRVASRFESHAHGQATVILDLATGLMWALYNRPMALDKAKWWANRVTAGYSGWRLPTVEEALTLREMDRGQYAGLPGFAVWTGDAVSDQPRSAWVLQLPAGRLLPMRSDESGYVWAVRQAVK